MGVPDWLGELRSVGITGVAERLGLELQRGRSLSPCPACGAERRGRHDRRGPVGVRRDEFGWRCHRCDAHGDAGTLASYVLSGAAAPNGPEGWRELRARLAALDLCEPHRALAEGHGARRPSAGGRAPGAERRARGAESRTQAPSAGPWRRAPEPGPDRAPAPAPVRPPVAEVASLWEQARPVTSDPAGIRWLRARGIAPGKVSSDVARVLRRGAPMPAWAHYGETPWSISHRLIVPLYDAHGDMVSLHARSLSALRPGAHGKAASPMGHEVSGLVMANPAARAVLETGATSRARVLVVEGVPDFLAAATASPSETVLGILSGSFTTEIAARMVGSDVAICVHDDPAGAKYGLTIRNLLRDR